jgi:hypothetical protein
MPEGSVRSIVLLAATGSFLYVAVSLLAIQDLKELLFAVGGFYVGAGTAVAATKINAS